MKSLQWRQRGFNVVALAAFVTACGGGGDDGHSVNSAAGPDGRVRALAIATPAQAQWSAPIALTLVPSAAANLPNGKVLLWSAQGRFNFSSSPGNTYTALFDPATGTSVERLVTETDHNMFCPGTTNLPDGRLLVNGGGSNAATSLYDPVAGTWSAVQTMNLNRAYQANTLLADGSVLTLGGSWSGPLGGKTAEVWTAAEGWRLLSGVPADPMVGPDPGGVYRGDNHMWLIPTANGQVLHAGPSAAMNWIDTRGNGATTPAGPRGDDAYAINGTTVMYDIGKILKTGGAPAYENVAATNSAHQIDVNSGAASVRRLAPMAYQRAFHNSVVLPNGQVLVVGGQTLPVPFSDNNSVLVPELWDPVTETFTVLPAMQVARNYHSTALLLPDGRVASIGGGLCGAGCAGNHPDLQLLTPHYLLNADGTPAVRPAITAGGTEAAYGSSFAVATDAPVSAFALVRMSSNTHTVNNDQRRIPLQFSTTGTNQYALVIPSNPGIALPGYYMLFALNASGVPSVAKTIRISSDNTPRLQSPGNQQSAVGATISLSLIASGPGTISYAATGLPTGLALNASNGTISGTPSAAGTYRVSVSASNAAGTVSTELLWTVQVVTVYATRYVKLEALTEAFGQPWTSVAEFNLLDTAGAVLSRAGWVASADSQAQGYLASAAIDGSASTIWHTQWSPSSPPPPHSLIIDRGNIANAPAVGGFKMLPRQSGANGWIGSWRLHVSADGVQWRVVAQGTFAADATEKTVFPINTAPPANQPPVLTPPANPTVTTGTPVSVALSASDPDGDTLGYSVSNLPPGLTVNASTGVISGAASTAGVYNTTVLVSDGRGGTASAAMVWTVQAPTFTIQPVPAPPATGGSALTYNANTDAGAGASYRWDFGDGSAVVTTANTTHTYASAGLYSVTLTVTNASGTTKTLTFTQAIYVTPGSSARATQSGNVVPFSPGPGSTRVWVVNADGDSVTLFDASTLAKIGEVAVGTAPRSAAIAPNGRLWVTNKGSATISVVDAGTLAVTQTIALPRASMPFGIAFAPNGGAAYVTLEATGKLLKLDPASGAVLATLDVGANPRHLAVTPASDRVLVSRFISPPLPGEGTATVQTQVSGVDKGGEVVVVTTGTFVVERTVVLRVSAKPDSTAQGRGLPNYLAAAVIAPDGASAWVPSKQDNVQRGTLRDGLNLDFQNTVRAISSRIDLATFAEDYPARVDHDNAGLASAAAFHPTGAYLFVALQTSRQIAVIDPVRKAEILRFDAGRAPDGLAVSADGLRLFVSNLMDRSLQVFDLARLINYGEPNVPSLASLGTQAVEKLSAQALLGKQLFYDARDPRLARDAYLSCASCHNDGGHDGRVWDMTGFGEGLRNTIALRGRGGMNQGFLHWTSNFDEVQDFEGQIRNLAGGSGLMSDALFNTGTRAQPLGLSKAGLSADLDAIAAYLASLNSFALSPQRQADGSLTASAVAGKTVFSANCVSCHGGGDFTDSGPGTLHNVGTLKASSGKRLGTTLTGIDTPTLRDVWATAPYLHDGSAATVNDAIAAHTNVTLTATDRANVTNYVLQIGSEELGPGAARYVRLQALTEVNGNPWASMAEFNLLDTGGAVMSRTGWVASADSQQTGGWEATKAIDGNGSTIWHTAWSPSSTVLPHAFTVDLGASRSIGGFKYLPRGDSANGRIANWRFYTSLDGITWTQLATGTFANDATEKTVVIAP